MSKFTLSKTVIPAATEASSQPPTKKARPTVRPPLPESHADVALCDIADVKALVRMSDSWIHDQIKARKFPEPVIRLPRCTRWSLAHIRNWLIERAAQPNAEASAMVTARAKKASAAARTTRRVAQPTPVEV